MKIKNKMVLFLSLAILLSFNTKAYRAEDTTATLSSYNYYLNGKQLNINVYRINGVDYFNREDLKTLLKGEILQAYTVPQTIEALAFTVNNTELIWYGLDIYNTKDIETIEIYEPIHSNEHFTSIFDGEHGIVYLTSEKIKNQEDMKEIESKEKAKIEEETFTMRLPNRKLTEQELTEWINEYDSKGGASEFELEVVKLVNIEREKEGLQPLEISDALMKSARFKSQEMVDLDYFSHASPVYNKKSNDITIPEMFGHENEIFKLTGNGTLSGAGENISGTKGAYGVPLSPVSLWINSEGHKRAILDKEAKTVGVGLVDGIWTINFGY